MATAEVRLTLVYNVTGQEMLASTSFRESHPAVREAEFLSTPGCGDFLALASSRYLGQTVRTLLRFAALESRGRGPITVDSRPLYLDHPLYGSEMVPAGEFLCVEIRDSGKGLSEEVIDKLFASGKDESNFPTLLRLVRRELELVK